MSNSIKLSPKYGVNPTIPCCFFCGKEKNEIALMGHIGHKSEDIEAPHNIILDYEPCDECKSGMAQGVTLIGYTNTENQKGQPPIMKLQSGENFYPTGSWCVMKDEAISRIFPEEIANSAIENRKLLVEQPVLTDLLSSAEK